MSATGTFDESAKMLFFKCCTTCNGDLLLEADDDKANLKCLSCGNESSIPANTHLFEVLCNERSYHESNFRADARQAA